MRTRLSYLTGSFQSRDGRASLGPGWVAVAGAGQTDLGPRDWRRTAQVGPHLRPVYG